MFPLRALFFAYEDRQIITDLALQTLNRLSVSLDNLKSPCQLWENIDAFMTDAVTKNLKGEPAVSETLGTEHIPLHILCKSHTCEKLDEGCLHALMKVEQQLKMSELISKLQPQLKSFICQNKCIAKSALTALLKLVSGEESGKPTSLAKEFNLALEERGLTKSLSLYRERRFTKLGYCAGSVFDSIPIFQKILEETTNNNLLVQACRLYLENEYTVAALKALSYFTYKVTMPYLNFVEKSDQNDLCTTLPVLYEDLRNGNIEMIHQYHVEWKHVSMANQVPTTDLDHYLLKGMGAESAEGVKMQCGREYFKDDVREPRATQLHLLSHEERTNIPTENLVAERHMAKFGYLVSISASRSNKFFKAKRIRDDLMFTVEDEGGTTKVAANHIIKALEHLEVQWTDDQKKNWK